MILTTIIGIATLFGVAGIAASSDDDTSCDEADERAARAVAEAERQRAKHAEKERRKQVKRRELERNLSDTTIRHNGRILAAKSAAADSKANLEKTVALGRDLDDMFN